ncbi:MAG: sodium:proton antiporter [Deltaproteobacteria bacterium]|nr:sodium:proton antiporter [Deltaproteobacteria bacterium]
MDIFFPHHLLVFIETSHALVQIGLLLLFGYLGGRVANYFDFPRVSGYIVIGVVLSPSVSGLFHEELVREDLAIITDIALGIIAFSIGGSLELKNLRRLYGSILWINFTQAFAVFFLVTALVSLVSPLFIVPGTSPDSFWQSYFPMALVIGAVSAATAPAAVLAIVHEYRAKGPLTTTLLGVVALDDATAIVFFTLATSVAQSLITSEAVSWQNIIVTPLLQIFLSLLLGIISGVILIKTARFLKRPEAMLGVLIGFIFLTSGMAISFEVSPLLANMVFGFMVVNYVEYSLDLFRVVESIEELIFSMFFTLAGAHINVQALASGGLLACLIVFSRFTGKLLGVRIGGYISHAPQVVKRYLGLALLPKAGVTVGLILLAKDIFGASPLSVIMVNAVLASVIINELIAPPLTRYALFKAEEANQE